MEGDAYPWSRSMALRDFLFGGRNVQEQCTLTNPVAFVVSLLSTKNWMMPSLLGTALAINQDAGIVNVGIKRSQKESGLILLMQMINFA
jgi:hypothetical protein